MAKVIGDEIARSTFRSNERLPTEQELTARFGVSHSVIREALAVLRAEGLVVTRQGAGVFVSHSPLSRSFRIAVEDLRSVPEIIQVMQLRCAAEVEAAGIAAQVRPAAALAEIERSLARMDAAIKEWDNAADADFALHLAIADATGNPHFGQFIRFLGALLIPRQTLRQRFPDADALRRYLQEVQAEHRALHAAIRDGDVQQARQVMRTHLEAAMARYRRIAGMAA